MEDNKNYEIPESEWSKDPELAKQIYAVRAYFEKTPFSKAFPNKHKAIVKDDVLEKTHSLFEENPNMPLKSVVATVLNSLNDDLSAELLLDMTRAIIEKWKRMSTPVYAYKMVEELV